MTTQTQEVPRHEDDAVVECIEKLLQAFAARIAIAAQGDIGLEGSIGEITVIVDADTEIDTTLILQHHYNEAYRTIFIRAQTPSSADNFEKLLMVWALNKGALREAVIALQPQYATLVWHQALEIAVREISTVFLNASVIEPTSARYARLKNVSETLSAPLQAIDEAEQGEPEVNDLIVEYIGFLLDRYDEYLDDPENEPKKILGSIRIIVDDGTVGARINDLYQNYNMFLMCLPTIDDADMTEYILMQWATDSEILEDTIRSFRPSYPDVEFYDMYIDQAVDEIADVLLTNVMVIPPESVMYKRIRKAVGC